MRNLVHMLGAQMSNLGSHMSEILTITTLFRRLLTQSIVLLCVFAGTSSVQAQGSAGSKAPFESRVIIDMPTAGVLLKNSLGLNTVVFAGGGLLCDASFAPIDNFNIGIGYSGVNILGSGAVTWQGIPSMHLRYRIIDETLRMPAILLGLQTQGRGVVLNKEFETAAPGIFASLSKQFSWAAGTLAFHGGVGYSVNLAFEAKGANIWTGVEQSLGPNATLMAEVNPTLNDTRSGLILSASLRWVISNGITLELQGRDIFAELPSQQGFTRTLSFEINRRL